MNEPTDYEQIAPGVRSFSLNSAYGLHLLGPKREETIGLRVMTERELAREANLPTSHRC
jgi:hypothetical protein